LAESDNGNGLPVIIGVGMAQRSDLARAVTRAGKRSMMFDLALSLALDAAEYLAAESNGYARAMIRGNT
jgi:nicotinamide mononucleotide adenylyltransferase